ncbi:MAG TPA: VTT domain-containing protein [Polyangiaceae bacterium]|nr:VTT domain-containing protein [Polyangiaceae bacterium]
MNLSAGESSGIETTESRRGGEGEAKGGRGGGLRLVLQSLVAVFVLLGFVSALAHLLKPELEAFGRGFLERFGALGLTLGTFLADGFHFPIPPQFYMLAAITSGWSPVTSVAAITAGSLVGGVVSHLIGRHLLWRLRFLRRIVDRSRKRFDWLFAKYGYWAVAVGSISPVPFSLLCNLSGLYKVPFRLFLVLSLFRVPRVMLFYVLIRVGWASAGGG